MTNIYVIVREELLDDEGFSRKDDILYYLDSKKANTKCGELNKNSELNLKYYIRNEIIKE